MTMQSSSASAGVQPPTHPVNVTVNPIQLLWLQESGIDRLWGRPLTISAVPAGEQSAATSTRQVTAGHASAAETARAELAQSAAAHSDSRAVAPAAAPAAAQIENAQEQKEASPARQALAKLREQMQRQRRPSGRTGTDTLSPRQQVASMQQIGLAQQATSAPAGNVTAAGAQQAGATGAMLPDSSARPVVPPQSPYNDIAWPDLAATIRQCTRCGLSEHARQPVPGTGAVTASLMIIDQAPGAQDEISGEPLSGQAGQLLDNMLAAIGLSREATFITDVVKCRPMVSRPPEAHEIEACADFLQQQIVLVQPACVLLFGNAAQSVLGTTRPVGELRQAEDLTISVNGRTIPVVVTFHPNHLMANQAAKPLAWVDLKRLRKILSSS